MAKGCGRMKSRMTRNYFISYLYNFAFVGVKVRWDIPGIC